MVLFASSYCVWIYHPHHLWSTVNQLWDPQLVIIWLFRTSRSGDCQIEMCDPHHELVSCHLPGGNTTNSVLVLSARAKKHTTTTLFWVLWPVGECLSLSHTHIASFSFFYTYLGKIIIQSTLWWWDALGDLLFKSPPTRPWETFHYFWASMCWAKITFQLQRMENCLSTVKKILFKISMFLYKG